MTNLPGGAVQSPPRPSPALKILTGDHRGKRFRLLSAQIIIGRHSDCDVIFKDNPQCSRRHARIKKEQNSYLIESLSPENPVLVNKKAVSSAVLKSNDKVTIGNIEMLFQENSPPAGPPSPASSAPRAKKQKASALTPPRLILIIVLIAGGFLFLSGGEKAPDETAGLNLRTESDILKEAEEMEALSKEESEKKDLSSMEREARAAFIKGFRDYRKGYFHRAFQLFQQCLTLHKSSGLCQSYSLKSKAQIEKLIQKKIRLGNAYKKNRQYSACAAVFKSVEIMAQDPKRAVYKEAEANRELCEIQMRDKI